MQHNSRVPRSAHTALTALSPVVGVAFATTAFVGILRRPDGRSGAPDQGGNGGNGGQVGGGDH